MKERSSKHLHSGHVVKCQEAGPDPEDSPSIGEWFRVSAGDRLPYFLVDGRGIYDSLREPVFHVLIFSDGKRNWAEVKTELEKAFPEVLDVAIIPLYPGLAESFGKRQAFGVLLRPDNHIGFLSKDISVEEIGKYLEKLVGFKRQA